MCPILPRLLALPPPRGTASSLIVSAVTGTVCYLTGKTNVTVDSLMPCPGQVEVVGGIYDIGSGLIFPNVTYVTNISIAPSTIEVFKSGTSGVGNTVAGPFDIQPRRFEMVTLPTIMKGKFYPQGTSGVGQYVLLDNTIEAVEGLIVDTRPGKSAVGFRNHTLPQEYGTGVTWREVILIISGLTI